MRTLFVGLIAFCLLSALSIVWIRHENRVLLPILYERYAQRDDLNIEWRNLLAERATLSRRAQLKNWASTVGKMNEPDRDVVLFLKKQSNDWLYLEHSQ